MEKFRGLLAILSRKEQPRKRAIFAITAIMDQIASGKISDPSLQEFTAKIDPETQLSYKVLLARASIEFKKPDNSRITTFVLPLDKNGPIASASLNEVTIPGKGKVEKPLIAVMVNSQHPAFQVKLPRRSVDLQTHEMIQILSAVIQAASYLESETNKGTQLLTSTEYRIATST